MSNSKSKTYNLYPTSPTSLEGFWDTGFGNTLEDIVSVVPVVGNVVGAKRRRETEEAQHRQSLLDLEKAKEALRNEQIRQAEASNDLMTSENELQKSEKDVETAATKRTIYWIVGISATLVTGAVITGVVLKAKKAKRQRAASAQKNTKER